MSKHHKHSKAHDHGHKHHDADHKKAEPKAEMDFSKETKSKPEEKKPDAEPVAPSDSKTDSKQSGDLDLQNESIASDAPAAATVGDKAAEKDPANDPDQAPADSKSGELFVSESQKVQEENSNTETGKVLNPGTTDATIEIVQHATPAADASIAAQKRDQAIADGEDPGYHPEADAMNPGPKVTEIADSSSGNSITGATAPAPFAPWDDAKAKADGAKDELVQNLEDAAKPATADGQADGPVPSTDATTASQASDSTPGTSDLENASGLSATDETAPADATDTPDSDSTAAGDSTAGLSDSTDAKRRDRDRDSGTDGDLQ